MNVSSWSIRNPVPAIMFFVLLCFGGVVAFERMKIQNFPDIELPMVTVIAALPGATPGQLENDVARKIENAIATQQGVKHIYTTAQDGSVTITVEFQLEKSVQEAVDDVRSAVSSIRADLPGDLRDPAVNRVDLAAQPVLAFTIRSPRMDDEAISWFVDHDITRRLLAVRGVGAVARVGGVSREIRVTLDPLRLQALGANALDISRRLREVQMESAGGRTDLGGGEQPIRTLGTVASAEELLAMEIPLSDGRHIRLADVATIADTVAEPRALALLNGVPVVGFEISRSRGESEVEVGRAVRAALDEIIAARPDIEITEAFNFVAPVEETYASSMHLLYEGALLAVLVVWLFLRDRRATLISAVALPLSIIPAFFGMYLLDFTINMVTLLALMLIVGILVDDAIVEVENIVRHLRMGKKPFDAAIEAANEIGLAVIATTFTLIAVFLPTAFMGGVAGRFFRQFGWTAALAVFASLVVARMLTPMMAAYLLKPASGQHREPRWLEWYAQKAAWCLKHRGLTMLGAGAFFLFSLLMIPFLPQGFIPADDNSQTQVYLELPPGSKLEETRAIAEQARLLAGEIETVESVYTAIGGGSAGSDPFLAAAGGEVRKATLTILLSPRKERPRKQGIENRIRAALETLPGARFKVGLGNSGEKYVLALTSEDPEALQAAATKVERDLRAIPGLGNITSSASLIRPEISVRPDFARAADLGVTSSAIGETLRVATLGDYDMALPKLNLAERQVPILVRLDESARQDLELLSRLTVPGARGQVMLGEVADFSLTGGPALISRYDRSRNINFEIELADLPMGDVSKRVAQLPSILELPPGVRVIEVGDAEIMAELFESFGLAMLTGILCIYVVLVLLFRNFLHPVTLLSALPLSLGGAFVGLLLTRTSFSMPSLLGLIMLMGIATKNSILLVEYVIVARRERGLPRLEALLDACRKRARPIVMTTIAMGAGMTPVALGLGAADSSFSMPMAIAVIGGLVTSTFLSLLVVPAVFTYIDDLGAALRRRYPGASR
ncbi:MAG: efflux RND transporter permease subunit [Zoogloeaceae bacterium]|nr:efflux RND transporter permease subunit [Zoogloeaceae bacterium]